MRVAPGKLETVTTCSRFIRALAACPGSNSVSLEIDLSRVKLIFFFFVFLLRRINGPTVKMVNIGMTLGTKQEIENREELMNGYSTWR